MGDNLTTYAPGDGALSFTFQKKVRDLRTGMVDTLAEGPDPTEEEVRTANLGPPGYCLGKVQGNLRAFLPVIRINAETVSLRGKNYRYGVEFEGNGWKRYWFNCPETGQPVYSENIRGALSFFLNNEEEINVQISDYAI